jgi:hypothetical protein
MTEAETPETLYHYTTAAGARGILTSGTVWATMVHYMNDAEEFRYALDLARDLISTSAAGYPGSDRHSICNDFLSVIQRIAVYVFSLTEHKDQLSQWRAYSGNGGYALGFERKQLRALAHSVNGSLIKCVYAPNLQRETLTPIINEMLNVAEGMPVGSRGLDLYEDFAVRFTRSAAAIKHPSFSEENEWRIVAGPGIEIKSVLYRDGGGLIIPYCQWPLLQGNAYPISTVVVGPTVPNELAARALRYLTSAKYGYPVRVEYSNSPLRPLR